jgi:FkbM family methyltransferase
MIAQRRMDEIRRELMKAQSEISQALKSEKSRKRADLNRKAHEIRQMLTPAYAFMSQAGQDVAVDRHFRQKRGGTFIDVGGYDGVTGSNTVFFEKWRGWTGVLVEPVAANLERAKATRSCPCLGYAVADQEGIAEFITVTEGFTQMSGLSGSYDEAMLKRVRDNPRHKETTIEVPTKPLAAILVEAGINAPDFVSLDIEGGELAALQSFPFADHRVGMWSIENNTGTHEIVELMREHNYDLIDFCGPDEIYALRNS